MPYVVAQHRHESHRSEGSSGDLLRPPLSRSCVRRWGRDGSDDWTMSTVTGCTGSGGASLFPRGAFWPPCAETSVKSCHRLQVCRNAVRPHAVLLSESSQQVPTRSLNHQSALAQ